MKFKILNCGEYNSFCGSSDIQTCIYMCSFLGGHSYMNKFLLILPACYSIDLCKIGISYLNETKNMGLIEENIFTRREYVERTCYYLNQMPTQFLRLVSCSKQLFLNFKKISKYMPFYNINGCINNPNSPEYDLTFEYSRVFDLNNLQKFSSRSSISSNNTLQIEYHCSSLEQIVELRNALFSNPCKINKDMYIILSQGFHYKNNIIAYSIAKFFFTETTATATTATTTCFYTCSNIDAWQLNKIYYYKTDYNIKWTINTIWPIIKNLGTYNLVPIKTTKENVLCCGDELIKNFFRNSFDNNSLVFFTHDYEKHGMRSSLIESLSTHDGSVKLKNMACRVDKEDGDDDDDNDADMQLFVLLFNWETTIKNYDYLITLISPHSTMLNCLPCNLNFTPKGYLCNFLFSYKNSNLLIFSELSPIQIETLKNLYSLNLKEQNGDGAQLEWAEKKIARGLREAIDNNNKCRDDFLVYFD